MLMDRAKVRATLPGQSLLSISDASAAHQRGAEYVLTAVHSIWDHLSELLHARRTHLQHHRNRNR